MSQGLKGLRFEISSTIVYNYCLSSWRPSLKIQIRKATIYWSYWKKEAFESLETKANIQSLVANFVATIIVRGEFIAKHEASNNLKFAFVTAWEVWNQEDNFEDKFAQKDLKKEPFIKSKT